MESTQKLTEKQKKDREVIFKRLRIYQEKKEKNASEKASEKAYENRLGPPIKINKNPSPITVPSDPGFKSGGRYKKSKKTKRKAKKSKKTRKNRKSKSKRKTRRTRRK